MSSNDEPAAAAAIEAEASNAIEETVKDEVKVDDAEEGEKKSSNPTTEAGEGAATTEVAPADKEGEDAAEEETAKLSKKRGPKPKKGNAAGSDSPAKKPGRKPRGAAKADDEKPAEPTEKKRRGRPPKKAVAESETKEEEAEEKADEPKAEPKAEEEKPAPKKRGRPPKKAVAEKDTETKDEKVEKDGDEPKDEGKEEIGEEKVAKKPKKVKKDETQGDVEKPKRGRPKGSGKKKGADPEDNVEAVKDEEKNGGDEKEEKTERENVGEQKDDGKGGEEKKPSSPRKRKEAKSSEETPGGGREKRARKSAAAFAPENFKEQPLRGVTLQKGRGTRLGTIAAVKESIEKHEIDDVVTAHRFVYPARGKPNKKECKSNLLAFSGYLPAIEGEEDKEKKEKRDKEDEALEEKMSLRAFKLTLPDIKFLIDFFRIDKKGAHDKDQLVERLLVFLGAPDEKLTVAETASIKKKPGRKKAKKAEEDDEDDDEDDDDGLGELNDGADDEEEKKPPTDDALRLWVRAYVRCFNLEKATTKHAVETASDKFGMDLLAMKDRIKELIAEEM